MPEKSKGSQEPEEEETVRPGFQSICVALQTNILGALSQLTADSAVYTAWVVEESTGETAAWKSTGDNGIVCLVNNREGWPDGQPLEQMAGRAGENER